jgi:tetratricopeptide (TPR) repeat protein
MRLLSSRLSIEFANRVIKLGTRPLKLTPRFFDLYCYLAVMRLDDPLHNEGYVDCDQVRALVLWSRNQSLSIGKQISRHVLSMQKRHRNVIQSGQKVGGPFRLSLAPSRIRLDVPTSTIVAHLALSDVVSTSSTDQLRQFFKFAEYYWRGSDFFNDGRLHEARDSYQRALRVASASHHWLASAFQIQRILERVGEYGKVPALRRAIRNNLSKTGRYQPWAEARNLVLSALTELRNKQLDAAEGLYLKALAKTGSTGPFDVVGYCHNGLGVIEKKRGHFPEAMNHYFKALDAWLLVDYFYGFQSVFFNIGAIYDAWASQMAESGFPDEAKVKYEIAIAWTEGGLNICTKLGIGYDMSEDKVLLSHLYRKLGKVEKAMGFATEALEEAKESGNPRSLALATRQLAKAYLAEGKSDEAARVIQENCSTMKPAFANLLGDPLLKVLGGRPVKP